MRIEISTWLTDNEFVGYYMKRRRYSTDRGKTYIDEEEPIAVYGWSKNGKSFFVYSVERGAIQKIGTVKRESLLDFRNVTV